MARVTRRVNPAGKVAGQGWLALVAALAVMMVAGCQTTVSQPVATPQPSRTVEAPAQQPAPAPIIMLETLQPQAPQQSTVALLLPLSGQRAAIGQSQLDAAQMALFDMQPEGLTLLPRDTQGTPDGAQAALRSALEDGAQLVLGPLLGPEATAIRSEAAQAGVRVLSFSSDFTVAGGGVYVMGFLPFEQVTRVLSAAEEAGTIRVGLLVPQSAYGEAVARAAIAADVGLPLLNVVAIARYADAGTGAEQAVAELLGAAQPLGSTLLPPTGMPPLDGVLIASGGDELRALLPVLQQSGLVGGGVRLLGTGLWDDPSLLSEPLLQGAWYAAPPAEDRKAFEASFTQLYGTPPHRLATLAYDAVALASTLAKEPGGPRFDDAALTDFRGFSGRDGIFRFRPDGLVSRGLAVYEVRANGPVTINRAPAEFSDLLN